MIKSELEDPLNNTDLPFPFPEFIEHLLDEDSDTTVSYTFICLYYFIFYYLVLCKMIRMTTRQARNLSSW